jgi:zinc transport system substrate-binding protein
MQRLAALTVLAAMAALSALPARSQDAPLKVTVTMKPVYALVLQVMDGVGKPTLIVDGASSPHTYALKPSDAKALNDADVVFRVSESVEPFTAKAVRGLPKTVQVVTLENAPGVKRLARRTNANFETKGGGGHKGHDHDHGAKAGAMDGHIWLDPDNAKAIVAHVAKVLAEKRPASAAILQANAAKATARLDALSRELETALKPVAGKPYVIFHDALQYFEARFGLTAVGAVTADPEVPPSGKRLVDLRKKVGSLGATCVFSEPTFETRVGQSIVEGTRARLGQLDPEGILIPTGPDAYDAALQALAKSLTACLASPS